MQGPGDLYKAVVDGVVRNEKKDNYSTDGRALAFTCAQVSVTDFASAPHEIVTPKGVSYHGKVYRLVRGDIAECHSQRESNAYDLACVNKALIKSCHMKKVDVLDSNHDTAWKQAKASLFETVRAVSFC